MPVLLALLGATPALGQSFATFETGQVRPLALSPDGNSLFAINTPDNRLEIFDVSSGSLVHTGAVPVGLEPIAVAARTNGEAWVVNHLSDSISIVDVAASPPRVLRTLLTCDEPRDIVFAGASRAFVTTARRGQNCPLPADLTTEGIGRAVVQVFDGPTQGGAGLGGTPLANVVLFGDTPRALAVAPGGGTVYAAVFQSGNQTTAISEGAVCNGGSGAAACNLDGVTMPGGLPGGQVPGGLPAPSPLNCAGQSQPETGLIVRLNSVSGVWEDELGRNWNNAVRFSLPDEDVFAIDASTLAPTGTPWAGVGTVLFNMIVNANGKVYVSNTEARNEVRFEGPGTCSTTVRGHLHEARITVLDGASVLPRHLNKHLQPYTTIPTPGGDKAKSFATPLGMAIDGTNLYVAAFGSSQVGVFDTAQIEADTFVPTAANHITVTGGGPSGLVVKGAPTNRLFVFTRFDNGVSAINTLTNAEVGHVSLFNPEPASVVNGRPVLYDAVLTSSNGEASCSACHVFGDFDSLAWDLGNPDDGSLANPNPFEFPPGPGAAFAPLKGPMTTQTLRGMANHGSMHWRGDRTGGTGGGDPLDEDAAFKKFIVAFDGLLGRGSAISGTDMDRFTDFILQVMLPPNPIRALDNSLAAPIQASHDLFESPCVNDPMNPACTDLVRNCDGCHTLDPAQGFFGTSGKMSFEGETQNFKVPHLRNMYQKVGMFGMPNVGFFKPGDNSDQGAQVRGFGFLHDGSVDTLFRFHRAVVFTLDVPQSQDMETFMMQFDSNLAPVVGQQTTLTSTNAGDVTTRLNLLIARAAAGECDVTVKGSLGGVPRGWYRTPAGTFRSDRSSEPLLTDAQVRAHATSAGQERTYSCVPPGSGERIGVDRDADGCFDQDEIDLGSDPANAASNACGVVTLCGAAPAAGCRPATPARSSLTLRAMIDPAKDQVRWRWKGGDTVIGDFKDPVGGSATYRLCIYDSSADPQPLLEGGVVPGGTCGTQPCWKTVSTHGFRFKDRSATQSGFQRISLKEGQAGKAQISVAGKGTGIPMPPLSLTLPVTVQLVIDDGVTPECWESTYTTFQKNDASQFRAKGP